MELPDEVLQQFRAFGRSGGRARARKLSPDRRRRIARTASVARWTRERFGVGRFAELALPGAELVDEGLHDLANDVESVEALLVAIAAPRLRREGIPVPAPAWDDPELRCYRLLEREHGELAHARYLALLDQMQSFADACYLARRRG